MLNWIGGLAAQTVNGNNMADVFISYSRKDKEFVRILSDSIENEANQKEIIRQEYKYEYEKQAAADSVKAAEEAKAAEAAEAASE